MEPLIKLRLLASKLKDDEFNQLIQNIVQSFTPQQIFSFIFNNFCHKYEINKTHEPDLQIITNMTSNIIQSREKEESLNDNVSEKEDISPITLDSMPSEMIRECSSYLSVTDYMHFARSNRSIYCASNSPLILKGLDISDFYNYDALNLNRFRLLHHLCICPRYFNIFETSSYPLNQNNFINLHSLHINNRDLNDHEDIETFTNTKWMDFAQITNLKCSFFGDPEEMYDFDSFINLLSYFPNVSTLEIENVYLTEFNDENAKIPKILSKLNTFICVDDDNHSVNLLRNKLMMMYCQQLMLLNYTEEIMNIDTHSFIKLNELYVDNPNPHSLQNVINCAKDLKILKLFDIKNTEGMRNTITKLFKALCNMRYILIDCHENVGGLEDIISAVEVGLFSAKQINRKSLMITLFLTEVTENISMREIELYLTRIINAMNASKIEEFMLKVYFNGDIDRDEYRYKIVEQFKQSYLAVTSEDNDHDDDGYRIIISNKNCKINGYLGRTFQNCSFF